MNTDKSFWISANLRFVSVHLRPPYRPGRPQNSGLRLYSCFALVFLAVLLSACRPDTAAVVIITATLAPVGVSVGPITNEAPIAPFDTPTPPFSPLTHFPTPSPLPPSFKSLTICLPAEPNSLYEYGGGGRESALARAAVLEALRDGPIDHRNFDYQPVILDKLPDIKDGDAAVNAATVKSGETMVDSTGRITALANGVRYFDPDGVERQYDGQARSVDMMQMTLTFRLRDGLEWEDGAPLTADDVLFAWQIAKSPDTFAADHYLTDRALDPVVIDPRTIQWAYLPGFKDTLYYTRFPVPYPRHLYGQLTPAQMAADGSVNRRPLSFGPFKIETWVEGDHIRLSKNPNYFRAAEGLPHLDQLIFRFVADPGQMIAQIRSGMCDIGAAAQGSAQDSFFLSQLDAIAQAETQGWLRSQYVSGTTYEHLDFNISPVEEYNGLAGTNLFQDVRVRQAFAYCIDRRALIDDLLGGRGDLPPAYVPASHPMLDPGGIQLYVFDPARGRALLQEAGWEDRNGDGILDRKGRALSLDYAFGPTGNTLRRAIAAALQAQLRRNCGIEIKPVELGRDALFGDFPDGVLFGRQFDLAQFAWLGGDEPPCGLYTRAQWTGLGDGQQDQYGLFGYPGGSNDVGYINPDFDSYCLKALGALDLAEKRAFHREAMELFSEDVPSIILFFKPKIALARPNVFGFRLDPTQDTDLWNVEAFDVVP